MNLQQTQVVPATASQGAMLAQAATAEEMSSPAANLQQLMSFFKVDDSGVPSKPRAAVSVSMAKAPSLPPAAPRKRGNGAATEINEKDFTRF